MECIGWKKCALQFWQRIGQNFLRIGPIRKLVHGENPVCPIIPCD